MDNSRSVFLDIDLTRQEIQGLGSADAIAGFLRPAWL